MRESATGEMRARVPVVAAHRQSDVDWLIDNLESMRNLDLGLGTTLNYGRAEHQASHKIWGTAIDDTGRYQPIELE